MKTLGIVFSNLHDKDVHELTANRTLASVPFAGRYRLIDFVLSSMVNSGIEKVGIITKSNYQSLMDHVGSGKHWDLARKNGGLIVLPPYGADCTTLYENRLQALMNIESFIKHSKEDYVVMSDCDNVANIDYNDVIAQHIKTNADITMVYRPKKITNPDKTRSVVELDNTGRITKFYISANLSGTKDVYANMMVIGRKFLIQILEKSGIDGLKSFSRDVIMKQVNNFKIYGYKFEGYFASIDSLANYYKHNIEMLNSHNRKSLFGVAPVFTKNKDSAPTIHAQQAKVSNSLIADGCKIEGTVINSVLFRGVHIAKNAVVSNSIIMQDSVISQGAELNCVIADKGVVVKEKKKLGGCEDLPYFIPKNKIL